MALHLSRWDVVAHLKTDDDIAAYYTACIAEGDAALTAAALRAIARAWGMPQVVIEVCPDTGLFRGCIPGYPQVCGQDKLLAELRERLRHLLSSMPGRDH